MAQSALTEADRQVQEAEGTWQTAVNAFNQADAVFLRYEESLKEVSGKLGEVGS